MATPADLTVLEGPADRVAPLLLGAVLRHDGVAVRLTEVEAYGGADDAGSHAFRGRTPRSSVMFGPPGRLYVYFTYGMHHCANVVTGPEGSASAVLLRAGDVVEGLDLARSRRPGASDRDLARGPARLCRALALTREHDGVVLGEGTVELVPGPRPRVWETGPRVGLREAPDRPWRFWLPGEPSVSAYRPAARRPRRAGGRASEE
ncbi:DNA-3-methyladenine glycosylase [Nocardioides aestuarii]|uniref:Putative 3-methyladenine DNA glycosylase n=1 Tax=Nocardioides aestuarii TaxID=252231 RepID=A0ABW4THD8_9ACTN